MNFNEFFEKHEFIMGCFVGIVITLLIILVITDGEGAEEYDEWKKHNDI